MAAGHCRGGPAVRSGGVPVRLVDARPGCPRPRVHDRHRQLPSLSFADPARRSGGDGRGAARRIDIRLEWRVHREGPAAALTAKSVDLWPLLGVMQKVLPGIHFTAPYLRNVYVGVSGDLRFTTPGGRRAVRRLAVLRSPIPMSLAEQAFPGAEPVVSRSREE